MPFRPFSSEPREQRLSRPVSAELESIEEASALVRFPLARPWLPTGYVIRALRHIGRDDDSKSDNYGWIEALFYGPEAAGGQERFIGIFAGRGAGPAIDPASFPQPFVHAVEIQPGLVGFIAKGYLQADKNHMDDRTTTLFVEDPSAAADRSKLSLRITSNTEDGDTLLRIARSLPLSEALGVA